MLTLSRRTNESISIGEDVEVVVLSISRGRVRLGIRAPRSVAVHRTELIASIEKQNQQAIADRAVTKDAVFEEPNFGASDDAVLVFPKSLFGLSPHDRFVLCEIGEQNQLRALVSCIDPSVQLLVVDAAEVWPGYPIEDAKKASGLAEKEVAVAAVCTVPSNGDTATVNLKAPIVIGLESRVGIQVILDRDELGMFHELVGVQGGAEKGVGAEAPDDGPPQPGNVPPDATVGGVR